MKLHQDRVSVAAHHLWQAAGSPNGRDQEFWFSAERRLLEDNIRTPPRKSADISMPWIRPAPEADRTAKRA
jgi:hypothetical protein